MYLRFAYRGFVELRLITPLGCRIDGRFRIRAGWTVLHDGASSGSTQGVEVLGPSIDAQLDVATAIDLDVLLRVGPLESGRPDYRLGYAGSVGDLRLMGEAGLVITPADEAKAHKLAAVRHANDRRRAAHRDQLRAIQASLVEQTERAAAGDVLELVADLRLYPDGADLDGWTPVALEDDLRSE